MWCVLVQNDLRFDAKCNAFWCKMQCVLVLNASQNDAKCSGFCRKMWGDKHKNAAQLYKYNLLEP